MANQEDIRNLLNSVNTDGTAFQSIVATSLQTLKAVRQKVLQATRAALSLGQQTKMDAKISELNEVEDLLKGVLGVQGKQILSFQASLIGEEASAASWWACIEELSETLALGIDCMGSIIKSQPKESPAHVLGAYIISVLTEQHQEFLSETNERYVN